MKTQRGFSLVEIMVAIAIVSILTALISVNINDVKKKSRDIDRQGDLRTLQSAIELYKTKYGIYPDRCPNLTPGLAGGWSGQTGTDFACTSGNEYITGRADTNDYDGDGDKTEILKFTPDFIPVLPRDPKASSGNFGYVYTVNAQGTVYKLMAKKTVESETVDYNHPFKSCDATYSSLGVCDDTDPSFTKPVWCEETDTGFQTSYGVWGGYANETTPARIERFTEDVTCDIK